LKAYIVKCGRKELSANPPVANRRDAVNRRGFLYFIIIGIWGEMPQ